MAPILPSATKTQSTKVTADVGTNEPSQPVKSPGGDQEDAVSDRDKRDKFSHLPSNTKPDDQRPTSQSHESASAHDMDADSSHNVSEIAVVVLPKKTLSAKDRIKLRKAAQAKYVKRWYHLLGGEFDTPEAMEWIASFKIDVLNKLESDKDGEETLEERKKRREVVVKRYLKKWRKMLAEGNDWPLCEELYKEFKDWMEGMEGLFDELTN